MADVMTRWFRGYRGKKKMVVKYVRQVLGERDMIPSQANDDGPDSRRSQDQHSATRPDKASLKDGTWTINGKVWVPQPDLHLQLGILVAAHSGTNGHRGYDATSNNVQTAFAWKGMDDDCKALVETCLHCIVSRAGNKIPRPLATALHSTKPNEVVYYTIL